MRCFFALILSFAFSTLTSFAGPILIFKGTGKQVASNDAVTAGPLSIFVVIDPATQQVGALVYYTRGKQKFLFEHPPTTFRRISFTLENGRNSFVYNDVQHTPLGDNLILRTRSYRGNTVGLKVSSQSGVTFPHPNILNFCDYLFSDLPDSLISSEVRCVLRYQKARSIAANDANKALAAVYDALKAELNAKGF